MKYINTLRDRSQAEYAQTEPTFDGSVAHFGTRTASPSIGGQVVPMVKASVRLSRPTAVTLCNDTCPVSVNSAVEITFNVVRGDTATLAAMRTEVNRLLDEAVADFQFANGLVPSGNADFASV